MKVMVIPIVIGALGTGAGRAGNQRTNQNHLEYSIVEIG